MKKQSLLLLAGGMLALASCQNEAAAPAAGPSDAQIDSMVNARVETIRMELMASNDSLINALAQWKADSMIAAMKGGKPVAKPKPVAKSKPSNNDFGNNGGTTQAGTGSGTVGNGKPSMSSNQSGTVGNGKPTMKDDKQDGKTGNGKPTMK